MRRSGESTELLRENEREEREREERGERGERGPKAAHPSDVSMRPCPASAPSPLALSLSGIEL
jgi:hypothetical protein